MAKKNQIITFIFILLSLFSYTQSIEIDPYNVNPLIYYKEDNGLKEIVTDSKMKEIRYVVKFQTKQGEEQYPGPLYLKIEISSESNHSPLLCFSHDDSYCKTRDIIIKNPNYNSVYVWAKKQQYEGNNFQPYFTVKCAGSETFCAYNITVTGADKINVEPDIIYSYLVTNGNKEMEYEIDKSKLKNDQRLVICLEGSNDAILNFLSAVDVFRLGNIKCANLAVNENDSNFGKFKIANSNEGEYLTLSVHAYQNTAGSIGRANNDFNIINTGSITSYIQHEVSNKECFPLTIEMLNKATDYLYITGKIHTKYAKFHLENENGEKIKDENVEIKDGLFSYVFNNAREFRYLCFEMPNEVALLSNSMIFSFKIVDYGNLLDEYEYEEPMNQGEIYRHLLPKGKIGVYHFKKSIKTSNKNDYTLNRLKGKSKLYFGECTTFPDCRFKQENLTDFNVSIPAKINNDMIYTANTDRNSALGLIKDVMVVHCEEALGKDYCEFDTSLFAREQDITLLQEKSISKFILKGEKGNMKVDLQYNKIINTIIIDLMIYNGDVSFSIKENDINYKQFYLSNKVLLSINKQDQVLNQVTIEYEANLNSYFTAKYIIDSQNSEQLEDTISSGQSYLVQIDPSSKLKKKNVYLSSILNYKVPFMVNFFEINCKFEVKRLKKGNNIAFSDGYAQDYVSPEDVVMGLYDYEISIKEEDPSNINMKMCMIYVSGVEIDNDNQYEREIVIPPNINQQMIFDDDPKKDFRRVRFTYPISDIGKDFAFRLNVIDKAHYVLNGYLNGQKLEASTDYHTTVTSMYYMFSSDLAPFCEKDKLCSFILDIKMVEKIVQTDPMIEITFREISLNTPAFLQKGNAKLDYVCGDNLYYLYTDLGKNDVGEITVNFLREFGNIWARIVKKDLKTPEKEANWRKVYHLPGPDWNDTLEFDAYRRKLRITSKDTDDCINGCYLLMAIKLNDVGNYIPDHIFYYFSILAKIIPKEITYDKIPKVVIQVDEYIIGSLDITEMDNATISEFYEIWFPHDSDQVEFDWQSHLASLYINVGGTRPTIIDADFTLHLKGTDGVPVLTKEEILKKAKEKNIVKQNETSIQDINLVIGIWTNITDSGDHELYSLRVHQHENNDDENGIEIVELSSDQKHVCKPRKVKSGNETIYRCLFVVKYNSDPNIDNPMFVYGFSSDPINDIYLLANFIDIDGYNIFDKDELRKLIPTPENAEYNTDKEDVKYIYIDHLPMDKLLYVSLYSYLENDLALINSIPAYNSFPEEQLIEFHPNSYTEQIFACTKEKLVLKFPVKEGLAVTIEVLAGEAEINWKNDDINKFKVKGLGDRIKLFSEKNDLIIKNLKPVNEQQNLAMANPGFLFFIRYKTRDMDFNFDDVPFGKSTEISYRETDLPIVLYSKLINIFKGLNMAISFKENNEKNSGKYLTSLVDITVTLYDQNTLYSIKKKKDKDMKPSENMSVKGYYDPAIKTALIYLSKEKIDSYNISESNNPNLYVRLDKNPAYQEVKFNFFNAEAEILGINDFVTPVEKVYHYGKIGSDQDFVFYPIKFDKNNEYLRIQVAVNSDELDFVITDKISNKTNITLQNFNCSREHGKVTVTLIKPKDRDSLYLIFFRKDKNKNNEKLSNYAFKYINAESVKNLSDYKINNPNITINKENSGHVLTCTFNKIHVEGDNADITYFLKIVNIRRYIIGEQMNTIAVTESPSYVYYEKNPSSLVEDKDKISIKAQEDDSFILDNWAYINVIAQIKQQNIIEYVTYNGIKNNNIIIKIRKEDNKKIIIGQKRILSLITNFYNKNNFFNDTYIYFNSTIKDVDNNTENNVNCKLWIPKSGNLRIICNLNERLVNEYQNILLNKVQLNYNNYPIEIIQEEPFKVLQSNNNIPFLYSEEQNIEIKEGIEDDKKNYELKFKIEEYNNEVLFLQRKNEEKIYPTELILDNCSTEGKDLTCKIEKEKIIENLYDKSEIFVLESYFSPNGLYKFSCVFDITINYNISKKEDVFVGVTKLLQNNLDFNNYIPYETNITSISNVNSDFFLFSTDIDIYMCKLKKTTDKPLLFLCLRTNNTENKSSLGKSDKEVVWDNIHTKYNFRIQPVNNSEEFTMKKNGSMIRINYPTKLDFNKADSIQIHLIMSNPENTQGIKLNPDSEELKCEQPDNRTKVCSVPKSHFKENGNYYIHYLNGDSKLTTFYEISPILVSLPKPEEPKTEKKSNLAGIIAGSVIGGLALIGIIVFLVVRYCKKKKTSLDDFPDKEENALIAINRDDD